MVIMIFLFRQTPSTICMQFSRSIVDLISNVYCFYYLENCLLNIKNHITVNDYLSNSFDLHIYISAKARSLFKARFY